MILVGSKRIDTKQFEIVKSDVDQTSEELATTKNKSTFNHYGQFIKTQARIIEPNQFETSFSYKIRVQEEDRPENFPTHYITESYFFFPPQINISRKSYPIDSFYRDMKSYINFRIPKLSFREIIGLTKNPNRSPLKKIRRELADGENVQTPEDDDFLRQEARMFGCSFYNFLGRKINKIQQRINNIGDDPSQESVHALTDLIEQSLTKAISIFREWRRTVKPSGFEKSKKLQHEFDLVDEYIVHILKDFLLSNLQKVESLKINRKDRSKIYKTIQLHLRGLRIYCKRHKYDWIDSSSEERDREKYLFRKGWLKRKVWSALYLDARSKPLFRLQQQIGAMLAAGFAGTWWVAAELLFQLDRGMRTQTQSYGYTTFFFATAIILAYILKDRIKDLGKGYLQGGIFGRLPDSNNEIIHPKDYSGQRDIVIGQFTETANYLRPSRVPADILRIVENHTVDEDDQKTVICYQQQIRLKEKPIRDLRRKIRAVYGFYRLNIGKLLGPLDQPIEHGLVPTENLHFTEREFPKTYHIDLVIKARGQSSKLLPPKYKLFRLTISKFGIQRIDSIQIKE